MALAHLIHWSSLVSRVAFCTWLISNMLFSMPVLIYGGYMVLTTGAFMIFSLLSFSTVRNSLICPIQFGTASLLIDYGGSFWLTLVIGKYKLHQDSKRSLGLQEFCGFFFLINGGKRAWGVQPSGGLPCALAQQLPAEVWRGLAKLGAQSLS